MVWKWSGNKLEREMWAGGYMNSDSYPRTKYGETLGGQHVRDPVWDTHYLGRPSENISRAGGRHATPYTCPDCGSPITMTNPIVTYKNKDETCMDCHINGGPDDED